MPETPIFPPGHNPSVQAVAQPEQNNAANGSSAAEPKTEAMDVTMNEIAPEATNSQAHIAAPHRTGTPSRLSNGVTNGDAASTSRANSLHPESTPAPFAMPTQPTPNGAPVRQYLNQNVTASLLEGMRQLAREQPKDPLRVLGEYLLQRSKEVGETS